MPLAEEKSRRSARNPGKGAAGVQQVLPTWPAPARTLSHTLTSDKGTAFSQYTAIAEVLDADLYFLLQCDTVVITFSVMIITLGVA